MKPMAIRGRSWWRTAKRRDGLTPLEWARVTEIIGVIILCAFLVGVIVK